MKYSKQPLDYSEILDLLASRGLIIADRNKAIECLKVVSYFRLDNYFHPMESDKVRHIFKPGSTFENAMDLYRFDCCSENRKNCSSCSFLQSVKCVQGLSLL